MVRKKIINELIRFGKEASKETKITKIILFGSQAWGKPHRDSDIDLLIVSPSFRRKKSFYRGVSLYQYWNINSPVDFLCYTPEEFSKFKRSVRFVREVAEKGIIIPL